MEFIISPNQRQVIYNLELNIISNIKFTRREIDIIACVVHNRGEKKIASLLFISPRTVGTHVHNIMLKIGHSSREYLMDFIVKSGKLSFLKHYYLQILIESLFNDYLIKIGKLFNKQPLRCSFKTNQVDIEEKNTLEQLKGDLELANIALVDQNINAEKNNYNIYTQIGDLPAQNNKYQNILLLMISEDKSIEPPKNIQYVDFRKDKNYYFVTLDLLSKLIDKPSLEIFIQEFKKDYQSIISSWKGEAMEKNPSLSSTLFKRKPIYQNFSILFLLTVCLVLLIVYFISPTLFTRHHSFNEIRSDLALPHESILLSHSSVLDKIKQKLVDKNGIQIVVLVGIGGSGKTTIAHRYARKQKIPLVWEINSETKESLIFSFKQLAYSLCQTEEEKQELRIIPEIKDTYERERKLLLFITKKIKNYPDWLIIYNNVVTFQDIKDCFPYDEKVWGNGKVIITTQDSNIAYNSYINTSNVIEIGELKKEEKLELFNKIINNSRGNLEIEQPLITKFLDKIPSFPLDISIAASYLKEEKISYDEYLRYISESKEEVTSIHEFILSDIGNYTKTRYDVISLPVKHIIKAHPDFKDLLLFISIINSQNIPKELLSRYKDSVIVSKFINELRKCSLITEKSLNQVDPALSIHRSTQTITLEYLIKLLELEKGAKQIQSIADVLADSMDKGLKKHIDNVSILVSHVEAFLGHNLLVDKLTASHLKIRLGIYYFYIGNYAKARTLLEEVLSVYKDYYGPDHLQTSWVTTRLGNVYRNMGDYHKAKGLLEKALLVYEKHYGKKHNRTAWVFIYLGNIYRNIGDYAKAKEFLENGFRIYQNNYSNKHIETARVQAYLGSNDKNVGNFKRAQELLEQALVIYNEYYGSDHTQTAWVQARLGNLYGSIGNYDKARVLLEQSLKLYLKHNGKNCIETAWVLTHLGCIYSALGDALKARDLFNESLTIYYNYFRPDHVTAAWVMFHLGNTYKHSKDYDKAQKLLSQALTIYKQNYGENHTQTAGIINSLGEVSMLKGDLELAKSLFNQALNIYKQKKHPEAYISLENLSSLFLKKYEQERNSNNIKKSDSFKVQSLDCLTQALEIVTKSFPYDSVHIQRIQSKLKNQNLFSEIL